MSFSFGTPKTATGFTLSTSTAPSASTTSGFQFGAGAGDNKTPQQVKPTLGLFGTPNQTASSTGFALPSAPAPTASTLGFNVAPTSAASVPQFSLNTAVAVTKSISSPTISFASGNATVGTSASLLNLSTAPKVAATASTVPTLAFKTAASAGATTSATSLGFSLTSTVTTTVAATTTSVTATTATTDSAIPSVGTLTFAQLEDAINKWTIDLEEQGKLFGNQAKQLNAWDRLLISNGEKIMTLNSGIERVKQQQQQLDQELDFVLAQQKELEDLIVPLEKELSDIPATDLDRNHTYQMAENLDSQLKQMSEDLKEVIEHLNEANKNQEMSNPITQIGKILNAHMNSLQWIDRNTTKIGSHLDQIAKMHDMNRRNHEINLQRTYD